MPPGEASVNQTMIVANKNGLVPSCVLSILPSHVFGAGKVRFGGKAHPLTRNITCLAIQCEVLAAFPHLAPSFNARASRLLFEELSLATLLRRTQPKPLMFDPVACDPLKGSTKGPVFV